LVAEAPTQPTPAFPQNPPTQRESQFGDDIQEIEGYGAFREKYPATQIQHEEKRSDAPVILGASQDSLLRRDAVVPTPHFSPDQESHH
jgi:hypothetical protein